MEAHLNLGSNIGDRMANLSRAVALIEARLGVRAGQSAPVRSEPWGYESANAYINIGVEVSLPDTTDPLRLLAELQEVEREISPAAHRKPDGTYADRVIDIDIIAIDSVVSDDPRLILPHPRMHLRRFVLEPLAALRPQWLHPRLGLTARQLLDACDHGSLGAES